jgi:ribonuclease HI
MLKALGAHKIQIFGDSKLVVQQLNGEAQCLDGILNEYWEKCLEIMGSMGVVSIGHVHREHNENANILG